MKKHLFKLLFQVEKDIVCVLVTVNEDDPAALKDTTLYFRAVEKAKENVPTLGNCLDSKYLGIEDEVIFID